MSKTYKCLDCKYLVPFHDLLECDLQIVSYTKEDKSQWTYDPTCIHDAEVLHRKWNLANIHLEDVSDYETKYNLTNRFKAK